METMFTSIVFWNNGLNTSSDHKKYWVRSIKADKMITNEQL